MYSDRFLQLIDPPPNEGADPGSFTFLREGVGWGGVGWGGVGWGGVGGVQLEIGGTDGWLTQT